MIDTASETLIPLREVPRLLPYRPNGKAIHISAVYRWAQRGVRGVRLEVIRIGGATYTSQEALQQFAELLSGYPAGSESAPRPPLEPGSGRSNGRDDDSTSCWPQPGVARLLV